MGGDCLNYGCVPSKALIKSAKAAQQMRDAERYGLEKTEPKVNFPAVMARIQEIITAIEPNDSRSEEHTSELQSRGHLVCRLLLEKKNKKSTNKRQLKAEYC